MNRLRILVLPFAILAVMFGAAVSVSATDSNHVEYWEALYPGSHCYKYAPNADNAHGSDDGKVVTLNPFQPEWPGDRWEVLVVKAGSAGDDGNGNAIYELPEAGVEYAAPDGKDISHWIVCKGATPSASATPSPTPTTTPVPTATPEVTPSPTPSPEPTTTPTASSTPTPSPTATPTPSTPPTPTPTVPAPTPMPTASPEPSATPTPETSLVPPTETPQATPPSVLPATDTLLIEEHPSNGLLAILAGLLVTGSGVLGLTWKGRRR